MSNNEIICYRLVPMIIGINQVNNKVIKCYMQSHTSYKDRATHSAHVLEIQQIL